MKVELLRLSPQSAPATRGILRVGGEPLVATLELPWRENQTDVSCIPEGQYEAIATSNRKTKGGLVIPFTFEVAGVPKRRGILFHIGNTVKDSNGCILIGEGFARFGLTPAISRSAVGFGTFCSKFAKVEKFQLDVRWIA